MKRTNRTLRFTLLIPSLALTAIPMLFGVAVFAQTPTPATTPPLQDYNLHDTACLAGLPCGNVSPVAIVSTIINIVVSVIGVLAVVMIVYGGILWTTAAGNEEKITKAKSLLVNAVIGIAIIMTAFAISSFVFSTLKKATLPPTAPAATTDRCANYAGHTCSAAACGAGLTDYGPFPDCAAPSRCCAP